MTTEIEMRRIVGYVLWSSEEMFVGDMPPTSDDKINERDSPGLVAKMVDGAEFNIIIKRVRRSLPKF